MATTKATTKTATDDSTPDAEDAQPTPDQSATEPTTSGGKTTEQLVNEVLGGRYGDHGNARKQLADEGHDAVAVLAGVNQRIAAGAPHAYKPTAVGLVKQVQDGEWGDRRGLEQRLSAAGFGQPAVTEVMNALSKE